MAVKEWIIYIGYGHARGMRTYSVPSADHPEYTAGASDFLPEIQFDRFDWLEKK